MISIVVAASFYSIPEAIGSELLLRHIHPDDPHGKIMLQGRRSGNGSAHGCVSRR
jgi:hypothetical protein